MVCPCLLLGVGVGCLVGRSVGRFALERFLSGGCPVCCSLRDPLGVRGFNGVGSLAIEKGRQLVWCSKGHCSTGGRGARLSFRPGGVQVCVCVRETESGRSEGLGRRWQAGWSRPGACGVRTGCAFGRGGGAKGQIEKWGKEALPSLSLSPVCLQHPLLPAARPAPRPGSDLLACCRRFDPRWV